MTIMLAAFQIDTSNGSTTILTDKVTLTDQGVNYPFKILSPSKLIDDSIFHLNDKLLGMCISTS